MASREKTRGRGPRVFAFGSSTPRDLSHLNTVPSKFRNYDAKLENKIEGPSLRDYILKARSLSREVPPQKPSKDSNRHVITSKDDDIASEPDFVQDREEFMDELRRHKSKLEKERKKVKNMEKASEHQNEHVKFVHAPEISGNVQKTVRIDSKTQEVPIAVENRTANKMNDQIEVSQLHENREKFSKPVEAPKIVGDLLGKVEKVAQEEGSKIANSAKEIANNVENKASEASETIKNAVKDSVEQAEKSIDEIKNGLTNL